MITNIKSFLNLIPFIVAGALFSSCEETINPDLEDAAPVMVVDAWLNNKDEDQLIILTKSQPYFEETLPPGVSGATVTVSYDGGSITFAEDADNTGTYRWTPGTGDVEAVFGVMGRDYTLTVTVDGETFTATSRINRTVPIDSVTFKIDDSPFYPDNSYTAEFWATEPAGVGDTYWIRAYKNGTLLNKPSELKVAYDAGFSAGGEFDGVTFIPPIRSVNPDDVDENDEELSPYEPGDSVYVEICSITLAAYNFINEVRNQTDRPGGFGELFSSPLANVSTNISNTNVNGTPVVGFFNVSAVSGMGKKLQL